MPSTRTETDWPGFSSDPAPTATLACISIVERSTTVIRFVPMETNCPGSTLRAEIVPELLTGAAVQIEFALVQWALGKLVARGFNPVVPPVLVREQMMIDAGFFPTDEHQVYSIPEDDLYLVGTAEVPLAGMHRKDRLDLDKLPLRYAGFSSCFRREAGTYGKDTRGIFRVHQFDKVEMFIWSSPDKSWDEHELLLEIERALIHL